MLFDRLIQKRVAFFEQEIMQKYYAEVDGAALRIGIAAYPGKVLVVPTFLVFDILVLVSLHCRFFLRFMLHTALEMALLISSARAASSSAVAAPSSRE